MFEAIFFENDVWVVHSFRAEDLGRLGGMAVDVFGILSDEVTLGYVPGKRLGCVEEAEVYLRGSLLRFHAGLHYLHFISDKRSGAVVGMIDIISPGLARQHYALDRYPYFIEFYLKSGFRQQGMMSELLPLFVKRMREQKILAIGAAVNRYNVAAKRVLQKAGFVQEDRFDDVQDLFVYEDATVGSCQ